jgi:large subunit ribosomal protein L3
MFGRKLGTLQVFDDQGRLRGVTAVEVGPCYVTQVKTEEKDGYVAVQLGYGEKRKLTRPAQGHIRAVGGGKLRHLAEFAVDDVSAHSVGDQVTAALFETGQYVDVTATSKGRGFQGGVKRHGFAGGPKTHGQSDRHRAPGSIGAGTSPGRVFKGTKMAGHMGAERVTVRNLEIVGRNDDRNVIFVAGSVPGPTGGLVRVRAAKKVSK